MAELTPISAEQRRAYYDALPAGRDEAARLGYGLIDDRIFAAFHRALYRPMLDAHEAEVRAKLSEEIAALAIAKPSEQWENGFQERGWNYAIQEATARVKRGHAANRPQIDAAAPEAHAESHRMGEGSSGAQEAVGLPADTVITARLAGGTPGGIIRAEHIDRFRQATDGSAT